MRIQLTDMAVFRAEDGATVVYGGADGLTHTFYSTDGQEFSQLFYTYFNGSLVVHEMKLVHAITREQMFLRRDGSRLQLDGKEYILTDNMDEVEVNHTPSWLIPLPEPNLMSSC